ncbi:hypothetical protein PoB_006986700 [Plakobranchus ocellatus]|uniref:Uncharacterized protein n=1 Tax=Plakobranchus ocellatus TaxID=259542 RepID=A0AAV4DGH6_9GAST|nr:hypothetical protein PoB_006986700 [Plakobranchus ocellatus]
MINLYTACERRNRGNERRRQRTIRKGETTQDDKSCDKPANEILWCGDRVAMSTAAKLCGCSSEEPCSKRGDHAPAFTSEKGRLPPAREAQQGSNRAGAFFFNLGISSEDTSCSFYAGCVT